MNEVVLEVNEQSKQQPRARLRLVHLAVGRGSSVPCLPGDEPVFLTFSVACLILFLSRETGVSPAARHWVTRPGISRSWRHAAERRKAVARRAGSAWHRMCLRRSRCCCLQDCGHSRGILKPQRSNEIIWIQ